MALADKKNSGASGNDANVVAFGDAERKLRRRKGPFDPPPHVARNGVHAQKWPGTPPNWTPSDIGLPSEDPCPVEPVGFEGALYHFIDSKGQFRSITARDLSHAGLQDLFAATPNYPEWAWPHHAKMKTDKETGEPIPPAINGFVDDDVRKALMRACSRLGMFSPTDKLRGRGAWLMKGDILVYHAGEELWVHESGKFKRLETGRHPVGDEYGHLYSRLPPLPAPWERPLTLADLRRTVGALLQSFRKWNFERPAVDPVLLLGWCGVAYLGGALDWRSALLLLGGFGTGKSELQKVLQALFGEHLIPASDATGPAIAQTIKQDTRAVALDELEAEADTRKVDAVVALMRAASSGDYRRRGSSNQVAFETHLRSAFIFSAINNPIQRSQDISRIAVLRLRELDGSQTKPPAVDADACGRVVLARLMSEFARFAPVREEYMAALAAGGHNPRGQKTYGTLLACADLLLGHELAAELEVPLTEDLAYWTAALGTDQLPESEDAISNWRACRKHLMTAQVPNWRQGRRMSVGQIIGELKQLREDFTPAMARAELEDVGLGLVDPGDKTPLRSDGYVLAVPNSHPRLVELFRGSIWQGSPGAGGPWKDALRQAPAEMIARPPPDSDAIARKNFNRVTIGDVRERCTLMILKKFEEEG